jgi:hypothetical protein
MSVMANTEISNLLSLRYSAAFFASLEGRRAGAAAGG